MAEIQVEGFNLGYTERPYDFTDDKSGERITGVSQRLHVLVDTEVLDIRVPDEMVATAKALPNKAMVSVRLNLPKGVRVALVDAETAA